MMTDRMKRTVSALIAAAALCGCMLPAVPGQRPAAAVTAYAASAAPVIRTQPTDVTAAAGTTANFTVFASGTVGSGLTYRWQYSTDGVTWADSSWDGANGTVLHVPAADSRSGYQYRCTVSNAGGSVITRAAKLTVTPRITQQPTDMHGAAGNIVHFSVGAVGSGLTYQWQYSADGSTWAASSWGG